MLLQFMHMMYVIGIAAALYARTSAHDERLLLARLGAADDAAALIHVAEAVELRIHLRGS